MKKKLSVQKQITVFILTIVIVISSFLLISIFFANVVKGPQNTNSTSQNTQTTINPTIVPTTAYNYINQDSQKIQPEQYTDTSNAIIGNTTTDNHSGQKSTTGTDNTTKIFSQIKTISGKTPDPNKFPYNYLNLYTFFITDQNNKGVVAVSICSSQNFTRITEDQRKADIKKGLAAIDIDYDKNTVIYSTLELC